MDVELEIDFDDALLKRAIEATGITDPSLLVTMGLQTLIGREAARRSRSDIPSGDAP